MARLEFGYPQKINGSRHTPTILRCALSVTSSQTPLKISNTTLSTVNYNNRAALHQSFIVIEDDMLILREPVRSGSSFTRLQLVPKEFYNIIFVAFHSNAIGEHLNAYRTLHRIRLH